MSGAAFNLRPPNLQRDLVAKKLSGSKLASAQHLASEWSPKKESEK